MVDIKTGDWLMRRGERQAREPHQPTPCHQCPKRSPTRDKLLRLNWRNQKTLELYYRSKAGGLTEDERNDPIVQRHLAALELVMSRWNASQIDRGIATMMATAFGGARKPQASRSRQG